MSWSTLMDRGRQELTVFPVTQQENARGTVDFYPDYDNPVRVRATTSEERSRIADLPGQVEVEIMRVITRSFPRGVGQVWSKVLVDGNEFDLSEPVRESFGPSRAMNHFEFKLRSRANIASTDIDGEPVPVIRRETR